MFRLWLVCIACIACNSLFSATQQDGSGNKSTSATDGDSRRIYKLAQPAFPGALGYARNTVGGRGGRVLIVNTVQNLVDPTDEFLSLREALVVETGPRYIVFEVGGVFDMGNDWLALEGQEHGEVTIACQSAPEPGVIIKSAGVLFNSTQNIIMRHCIIRNIDPGAPYSDSGRGIGVGGVGSHSMLFDHLSISWATDENFQVYLDGRSEKNFYDFTLSNSIIAEGDARSSHSQSSSGEREHWDYHSMGPSCNGNGKVGVIIERCSIVNNLMANNSHRNGMLWGSTGELVSNIIYNWNMMGSTLRPHTAGRSEGYVVNNLYKAGPSTRMGGASDACTPQCAVSIEKPNSVDKVDYEQIGEYRLEKNYYWPRRDRNPGVLKRLVQTVFPRSDFSLIEQIEHGRGSPNLPQETLAAVSVIDLAALDSSHMRCLGASRPKRDTVDVRIVGEFHSVTGLVGIGADHNRDYSDYSLGRHGASYDVDRDGMADAWEVEHGLNPSDSSDAIEDRNSDGYPNIEEFLNFKAECS